VSVGDGSWKEEEEDCWLCWLVVFVLIRLTLYGGLFAAAASAARFCDDGLRLVVGGIGHVLVGGGEGYVK
jgi:hypothetical protein